MKDMREEEKKRGEETKGGREEETSVYLSAQVSKFYSHNNSSGH